MELSFHGLGYINDRVAVLKNAGPDLLQVGTTEVHAVPGNRVQHSPDINWGGGRHCLNVLRQEGLSKPERNRARASVTRGNQLHSRDFIETVKAPRLRGGHGQDIEAVLPLARRARQDSASSFECAVVIRREAR